MSTNNNKKNGNHFEEEFCELLALHGFWAHNMAQNQVGQPADVIAVKNGIPVLIDCKECETNRFPLSRIEGNQEGAMTLWEQTGNEHCYFAMKLKDGRIGKQVAQTITTSPNQGAVVEAISGKELSGLAIRKLTPKECFRLMGFDDSDVDKLITNGISNTQLYKMAGNSIVVTVLENLFRQIYKPVTQSIDSLKRQSLDILDNI